ncbi:MAG: hypothetical protein KJ571_15975 [Bacteroidetes bacterium]|nr:hypothetical protein [Bacteroidota bacterium]
MGRSAITIIILSLTFNLLAQEKTKDKNEDEFYIGFKGFVKTDIMIDSRQTVTSREGHFLLYPQPEVKDINNEDINEKANLNMLSIQTRLTAEIKGPKAFGAKTSGLIEGAFFGHSDGDINGFRLRHAFLKLDWGKSSLLIGQYWNPMFITEVFPGVISFNTGVPFQPFARNPQIRFVQKMENVELAFTAAAQRDFASTGPFGTSTSYLRNSVMPILDVNLKYISQNLVAGAGVNLKSLTPRIVSTNGFKTDESVTSISTMAFAKISEDNFTIKLEGVYGENLTDLLMLGGYAVKSVDAVTAIEEYTGIKTLSAWTDLSFGKQIKFGLFAGYTKNLGADENLTGTYYSRGSNIESVIRVSPRVQYRSGNTEFACEVEYTSAAYGIPDIKGEVLNTTSVSNLRLLVAAYLFF